MGKTKLYATMEDNLQQPVIRHTNRSQSRRHQSALGRRLQEPAAEMPSLNSLFRQVFWRLRRHWLALSFQANRYTLGFFRTRTVLKLGAVSCISYLVLFSDRSEWLILNGERSETMHIGPVETSLETPIPSSGQSLDWNLNAPATPAPAAPVKKTGSPKNGASPMAVQHMQKDQVQQYIGRFSNTAVQEMRKFGIPASISLAQGLVESRYGTSTLAVRNNNHFGMKCFSKKCPNGHCSNYGDDHHKDFFRKYKSPWESWRAHSLMLANGRYARLKKHGNNYRKWAQGLESLGYATDRSYAEKLIGVIERYQLHRFDR